MKKSTKREAGLSACQLQATRLNKLESRRLQQNVHLMRTDVEIHLACLERQAEHLRHHYTNVVRVVQPNRRFQLWKEAHVYQMAQDENKERQELMKAKQKSKSKLHRRVPSSNDEPSKPVRPLLLLVDNDAPKPIEPILDSEGNFLRPRTSLVKKHLPNSPCKNPLWTMFNDRSIKSGSTVRSNLFERDGISSLPSIRQSSTLRSEQNKSPNSVISNLDALYRIALQNQTAYQSVARAHIEKRKLLDKEFASQYRALKGTIGSGGLVK